jgi:hypothetical protein
VGIDQAHREAILGSREETLQKQRLPNLSWDEMKFAERAASCICMRMSVSTKLGHLSVKYRGGQIEYSAEGSTPPQAKPWEHQLPRLSGGLPVLEHLSAGIPFVVLFYWTPD